ncbi:MAG TPA: hypothetical protein ENN40_11405 [Candidatus Aminicenantes bacterium]|nr:hypothetical protein [Candidatus Aminicenantes bacterium]
MKRIGCSMLMVLCMSSSLVAASTAQRVSRILALKQFYFELSLGVGLDRPQFLPIKSTGTDDLMRQYAEGAGASLEEDGRLRENIVGLPLRAAVTYRLDNYWSVKAGLGFSVGGATGDKTFILRYPTGSGEQFALNVRNRIQFISPSLEVEHMMGRFSIFAGGGVQWGRLSHTFSVENTAAVYSGNLTEEITATGTGALAYLGGAYRYPLGGHACLLFRLEVRFSGISNWNGSKNTLESDNMGNQLQGSLEGKLMRYEWNPYGRGWVEYWDLGEVVADERLYRNASALSSRLSGIRFTIGISF